MRPTRVTAVLACVLSIFLAVTACGTESATVQSGPGGAENVANAPVGQSVANMPVVRSFSTEILYPLVDVQLGPPRSDELTESVVAKALDQVNSSGEKDMTSFELAHASFTAYSLGPRDDAGAVEPLYVDHDVLVVREASVESLPSGGRLLDDEHETGPSVQISDQFWVFDAASGDHIMDWVQEPVESLFGEF